MSSSSDVFPVPEEEVAAPLEALAWGTSPRLYLSYGMVAMKGMRPVLTDAVEAAPSFTVLSPPMGLDFFAVLDGRGLGAAAAGGYSEHLLALLRDALAGQVYLELCSDSPWFLDGTSRDDVVGWWATTLREAFRAFHEEFAACSQGEHGVDAPAATAIVALVHEKYLVIGNCGASKAVLSRDGELVELSSDSEHMVSKASSSCIWSMSG
jgi:protein phosphatase 2C